MRISIVSQHAERRHWKVQFCSNLNGNDGICDYENKTIRIHAGLRGQELTETFLHEMLHAAFPHINEDTVTDAAADMARVLHSKSIRERVTDGASQ